MGRHFHCDNIFRIVVILFEASNSHIPFQRKLYYLEHKSSVKIVTSVVTKCITFKYLICKAVQCHRIHVRLTFSSCVTVVVVSCSFRGCLLCAVVTSTHSKKPTLDGYLSLVELIFLLC